ncbi:alpha/beta hydrolase family protein [Nocardia brasiliensis]|nr:alpha/beta hydrolase [Nocardia brasiliensis]
MRSLLVLLFGVVVTASGCTAATESAGGVRSSALSISFGDFVAEAELMIPGKEPAPLVVLVGGSGPEDMNGDDASEGGTSRGHLFADIARSLADQGFATLRYNKHYVHGIGDIDPRFGTELTMPQLVADVRSAVEAGVRDPRIDPERIYLLGWSEGTTVVAAAAPELPNVRGVILLGVVGIPWRDGLIAQWERVVIPYLRDYAVDGSVGVAELDRAWRADPGVVVHELLGLLGAGTPAIEPAFDPDGNGRIDLDTELSNAAVAFIDTQLDGRAFRMYGSASTLPDVAAQAGALRDISVLTMHGEHDSNVAVAAARQVDAALAAHGSRDHTLLTYPDAGHSLGAAKNLAHDPIGPIRPQPLADLAHWLHTHEPAA